MDTHKKQTASSKSIPSSDEEREQQLTKDRRINIAISLLLIAIGTKGLFVAITNKTLPAGVGVIEFILFVGLLILVFMQGRGFIKHKLAPIDEYEARQDAISKAKAFNFLSTGIFLIIILFPQDWALSLLLILLGYSWFMVAQGNSNGKEAAK